MVLPSECDPQALFCFPSSHPPATASISSLSLFNLARRLPFDRRLATSDPPIGPSSAQILTSCVVHPSLCLTLHDPASPYRDCISTSSNKPPSTLFLPLSTDRFDAFRI